MVYTHPVDPFLLYWVKHHTVFPLLQLHWDGGAVCSYCQIQHDQGTQAKQLLIWMPECEKAIPMPHITTEEKGMRSVCSLLDNV